MKTVKVQINWLKQHETSYQPIISDIPYRPIIVFKNQCLINKSNEIAFSAEIFNEKIDKTVSLATLTLRALKAPLELLKIGTEFELYETSRKVAEGRIIEEIE